LEDLLEFLNETETENKDLLERSTPKLTAKQIGQLANLRVIYNMSLLSQNVKKEIAKAVQVPKKLLKLMFKRYQEYLSMMNKRIRLILNAV
jgi:hypothetical protein